MAPPRSLLCWLSCSGTLFASLVLLCLWFEGSTTRTIHRTRRARTLEHLLYDAEVQYGESIATRNELTNEWRLDDSVIPNIFMFSQLYPTSFHCPYPLTLVGTSWVCNLDHLAEARRSQCAIVTIGPMNDPFVMRILEAAPDCMATAYTPGSAHFGHGRVYMTTRGGSHPGGRGWAGLGQPRGPSAGSPQLVHEAQDIQGLRGEDEHTYTLEGLLGGPKTRFVDILRIDLPFSETVRALMSLPILAPTTLGADAQVLPVGQLVLVLRPEDHYDDMLVAHTGFRGLWESLERVGMRPFAVQERDDDAVEYSFLNIRALIMAPSK